MLMLIFKFQQSLLTTLMERVTGPSSAERVSLEPGGWGSRVLWAPEVGGNTPTAA